MKAGVSTTPRSKVSRPRREEPHSVRHSNFKGKRNHQDSDAAKCINEAVIMRRMILTAPRILALLYGLMCYTLATLALSYAGFFLANAWVPKTIDSGPETPAALAIVINIALIALFGLQHSVMARASFKQAMSRIAPYPIERSTYVLAVAIVLCVIYAAWRPMPSLLWSVSTPWLNYSLWVLYFFGWALTFASTCMHNHFELMGVRQPWRYLLGKPEKPAPFRERALYKYIRHPMMLGLLIVFWATPEMSHGRLLFALGMTTYIFIGIAFEERDLLKAHGESYARFKASHPMLIPRFRGTSRPRS